MPSFLQLVALAISPNVVLDKEANRERNAPHAEFALTLISGVCGKEQRNWWRQTGAWFRCWPPSWSGTGNSTSLKSKRFSGALRADATARTMRAGRVGRLPVEIFSCRCQCTATWCGPGALSRPCAPNVAFVAVPCYAGRLVTRSSQPLSHGHRASIRSMACRAVSSSEGLAAGTAATCGVLCVRRFRARARPPRRPMLRHCSMVRLKRMLPCSKFMAPRFIDRVSANLKRYLTSRCRFARSEGECTRRAWTRRWLIARRRMEADTRAATDTVSGILDFAARAQPRPPRAPWPSAPPSPVFFRPAAAKADLPAAGGRPSQCAFYIWAKVASGTMQRSVDVVSSSLKRTVTSSLSASMGSNLISVIRRFAAPNSPVEIPSPKVVPRSGSPER